MQAARIGIHWKLGNGRNVRFWEGQWLGNTSLAIIYWPMYVINEQHGKTVEEVWDGMDLKLTFRRTVSEQVMNLWWELVSLINGIVLSEEEDQIVWAYTSSGKYIVQSLYAVVNFRGITPVFVNLVWKLPVPPRVQFFLWLLSSNKLLTRDNLAKRREISDPTCLLCSEKESILHLFFDCCVASLIWEFISEVVGVELGQNFESVARFWVANKRHKVTNIVSTATLWSIWNFRNEICFQGRKWMGLKDVLLKIARMLKRWRPMMQQELGEKIEGVINQLEQKALSPP